jgi:hypothetical protein
MAVEDRNSTPRALEALKRAAVYSALLVILNFWESPAMYLASFVGEIGTSFVGGFETWGRSFGRP